MWILWTALILLVLLLVYAWAIHPVMPKRPIPQLQGYDYAHRGYWNTNDPGENNRPENSLAALRAAVEKNYGIELDVHLTKDGHLVVHHDDSLKRLTGVDIHIADSTLAEVRACKLPNGEPIPTYDEVLDVVSGRIPMVVEVKVEKGNHAELCKAVYERMQRYDGPWCLESFSPRAVQWFRLNAPEIIRGQLAHGLYGYPAKKRTWLFRGLASLIQNVVGRPDFVAYEHSSDRNLPMALMRLLKPWLVCWTVHCQGDMDLLVNRYDLQIFEGFIPKH